MLKIRYFFAFICTLFLTLPMLAQQLDAKAVLDRAAVNFEKAGSIKAEFTVRTSEGNSAGVICLKGEKFFLEADGVSTWFDGHTQWSYLASSDEVNVSEPTPEELQSLNPYALLYLYRQGYKLKLEDGLREAGKPVYKVVMTATDRRQDLQCIILYIAKDSFEPLKISMAQRGGRNTAVILIDSYQTGKSYPDTLFVFNKKAYPTAEWIDLR